MSFPRYPAYKDSGVEWLGEVPAHWGLTPLKYLVTLRSGGTPSKQNLAYWDGDVPWASSKDLKPELLWDTEDHITQKAIEDGAAELVPAASVLVVVRGMILLHTFPVVKAMVPMAINQDLKAITPGARIDPAYLAWLLRGSSRETLSRLHEAGHGTKVLRIEAWTSMLLPVPALGEQVSLATFLDRETAKIDALIAEQQRLSELLTEKRQAVISHAVTKGLNPDAPMKESGIEWLGEVPAHWRVVRLRRAGRIDQGNAFSHSLQGEDVGDLPWFKVGDMNRLGNEVEMRWASNYVSSEVAQDERATIFPAGTTIFPRVGAALLTNKRRLLAGPAIVDDNLFGFIPREVEPRFVYMTLLLLDMAALCSAGLVPTITFSVINDHGIPLPPRHEQLGIVAYVDGECGTMDALTAEAQRAIDLLQERRTALISAAVTGQIDVRGVAAERSVA